MKKTASHAGWIAVFAAASLWPGRARAEDGFPGGRGTSSAAARAAETFLKISKETGIPVGELGMNGVPEPVSAKASYARRDPPQAAPKEALPARADDDGAVFEMRDRYPGNGLPIALLVTAKSSPENAPPKIIEFLERYAGVKRLSDVKDGQEALHHLMEGLGTGFFGLADHSVFAVQVVPELERLSVQELKGISAVQVAGRNPAVYRVVLVPSASYLPKTLKGFFADHATLCMFRGGQNPGPVDMRPHSRLRKGEAQVHFTVHDAFARAAWDRP